MTGMDARIASLAEELIDEQEVLRLARDLVRIPSIATRESRIADFISRKLTRWGLEPKKVEVKGHGPDVVAEVGTKGAPCVILNGHMDTVEVMSGWRHDPFGAAVEGGMLYGLGALDMKAGLAAEMLAFRALAEAGVPRGARAVLQAVSGEEDTGAGTRALISKGWFKRARAVIVGEGFGALQGITIGRRGGYYFEIEVQGRAAHGAEPEHGINAISDAAKIVQALDGMRMRKARGLLGDDFQPLKEDQTVLKISGGSGTLSVPERCTIKVVRCVIPGMERDVGAEIRRTIAGLGLRSKVSVRLLDDPEDFYPPFKTPANSRLVKVASKWLKRFGGKEPKLAIGRSEADDNKIAEHVRAPVICFGPGELGELARYHQPEEAVSIDQLGPAARAYFATVFELFHER